ncbi:10888_t:CDS:2, partial [Gigaspora rosea]
LSQSEVSTSDERNNMVDEISVECVNLVNNNDILDEYNNLINEYENSLVIEDNQDNQDNALRSILQSQPKNISKTPNLKEIKLIPIMNHSGQIEVHKNNKSKLCGHLMGSVDSLTRNYIGHLATQHGITESSHNKKIKQPLSSQLQIDKMIMVIQNLLDAGILDNKSQHFLTCPTKQK